MNAAVRVDTAMECLRLGLLRPQDRVIDKVLKVVTPRAYKRRVAAAEKRALVVLLLGK